jgi:pSer/pThr/pTyr-binding forkhead associated (FHA) protein
MTDVASSSRAVPPATIADDEPTLFRVIADDEPTRVFDRDQRWPITSVWTKQVVPPRIELEVTSRTNGRRSHTLPQGRYRVGTLESCDIVIDDPWVSRAHLELEVGEHEVRATDLGSTNGSYCDGVRFDDRSLPADASIVLGKSRLRIRPMRQVRALAGGIPALSVALREPAVTRTGRAVDAYQQVQTVDVQTQSTRRPGWHTLARVTFVLFVASVFTTAGVVADPSMLDQVCEEYDGFGTTVARAVRHHAWRARSALAAVFEPL